MAKVQEKKGRDTQWDELFQDKSIDDLYSIRNALDDYIKSEKERLDEIKAASIRNKIRMDQNVAFYSGPADNQHLEWGKVVKMSQSGVTIEKEDGTSVNRRFKKLNLDSLEENN